MTNRTPTQAETKAARDLAAGLRGHLQDPDGFAERFIARLIADGWRTPLDRPAPLEHHGAPAADPHSHAAAARDRLADTLEAERLHPTPRPPARADRTRENR